MRIEQTFTVESSPESVFDYMTNPANLRSWQRSKTRVEVESDGPPGPGFRVREWTKPPGGREFEQLVEFTDFERPNRLVVHVVEGPQPIDGTWVLSPLDGATRVDFVAEGRLDGFMRIIEPLVRRTMDRQFAKYHELLRQNVESAGRRSDD